MSQRSYITARFNQHTSLLRVVWALLVLCALLPQWATAASAPIEIRNAYIDPQLDVLQLNARLDFSLPTGARTAVHDGAALTFDIQFELRRVRSYWRDEAVASLTQRYVINYHALSERYILRNLNSGEQSTFGSLDAALQPLHAINALPILDRDLLGANTSYEARLHAELDVHTLPDAIRWVVFWADNWRQDSDWYLWPLKL